MPISEVYNMDCLEYMKTLPDNYFDLAVVDPPYGGGAKSDPTMPNDENQKELGEHFVGRGRSKRYAEVIEFDNVHGRFGNNGSRFQKYENIIKCDRTGGTWASKYSHPIDCHRDSNAGGKQRNYEKECGGSNIKSWDIAPSDEYFEELFRVSKNQIIWGGNYFALPPTRCFIVWRKLTISEKFTMAMAEYAWTSFNSNAKVFECAPQGKQDDTRFHPTQKPIELYAWVFKMYAKQGYKILDTHLGSGSSRIAAYGLGFDFYACEIDPTYFRLQQERFERVAKGNIVMRDGTIVRQLNLFE